MVQQVSQRVTDIIGAGSLKLVSGWSLSRSLDLVLDEVLSDRAGTNDVRRLQDNAFVVYTEAEPADVRNWVAEELTDQESVLVVEFERWSSHGPAVDRRWLLRRGH
jgi:hypothetical protein